MIKIKRTSIPDVLSDIRSDLMTCIAAHQAAPTGDTKDALDRIKEKYSKKKLKNYLVEMQHDKCAYCESFVTDTQHGDIEHFWPKSKYPVKVFDWNNLFLACQKCNYKGAKGDKFPIGLNDKPLYINPAEEEPDDFFIFDYDEKRNLAQILPRNGSVRANTMIRDVDLNRWKNGTNFYTRFEYLENIATMAKALADGDRRFLKIIIKAVSDKAPYTAFTRTIVRDLGIEELVGL